jgi:small subunit ribosomal protein S17
MAQERRKKMVGLVVSDKMAKTVIVQVATRTRHPLYGKVITRSRRFKAHNEDPVAKAGDTVKIVESRPLSREKRWRVAEIVRPGEVIEAIREVELESLIEKERAEREARKAEERRRAEARLTELAGETESEAAAEEMQGETNAEGEESMGEDEEAE